MRFENIVIDANNLFWRCSHSAVEKIVHSRVQGKINIGVIQEFFRRLEHLLDQFSFENSKIYFLFDNSTSKFNERKIISNGEYKHSRVSKNIPKHLYQVLKIIEEILRNYNSNFYIGWGSNLEADDLTKPIKNSINVSETNRILFISNDMDWSRNIDKNCSWYNYEKVFTPEEFFKEYEFWPTENSIKLYKTLKGDPSDNIPVGVPHLPKDTLLYLIQTYTDLEDLLNKVLSDDRIPKNWRYKIKDRRVELKLNYQLVDFFEVEGRIEDIIFKCERNVSQIKIWFNILKLPVPIWAIEPTNGSDFFLS